MYNITARDIACVYHMVLTLLVVLCQLKKSNMVYDVVGGVGRNNGLQKIYISVILLPAKRPPLSSIHHPPTPPNILRTHNKKWRKQHFVSGKAPLGLFLEGIELIKELKEEVYDMEIIGCEDGHVSKI